MYRLRIHRHRRCRCRRRRRRHIQWAKAPKSHSNTHTLSDTLAAITPHIHNYIYIYNSRLDGRVQRAFSFSVFLCLSRSFYISMPFASYCTFLFCSAAYSLAAEKNFLFFVVAVVLSEKS